MVPSARRLGSHSRTSVGMPGCMMAMPNPETIAAAYSVQTSMAAARAAPPIAAIVIPSVTARVAPTRAIKCIAHVERGRAVVDLIEKQAGNHRPFDPVAVVYQFVNRLREYGISKVYGDHYGGHTFRFRFDVCGIQYIDTKMSASDFYERLEVRVNAGECELPGDVAELTEELLTLVVKGAKVTHEAGSHDDFANACAIAVITTLEYEINRVHWYCA
jgi:hypothetical protein